MISSDHRGTLNATRAFSIILQQFFRIIFVSGPRLYQIFQQRSTRFDTSTRKCNLSSRYSMTSRRSFGSNNGQTSLTKRSRSSETASSAGSVQYNRFFDGVGVGQQPKNQWSAFERGGRNGKRERESEWERERDKSKLKRIANVNERQRKRKRDGMRHSIRTEHMHNYRASFAAVSTTHAFLNYAYAVNRASCLHTARWT